MKFLALNVDFDGPSLDLLGSGKHAHEGIKSRTPQKSLFCCCWQVYRENGCSQAEIGSMLPITTRPPKYKVFNNFLRFLAATHILRVNCAEIAGN